MKNAKSFSKKSLALLLTLLMIFTSVPVFTFSSLAATDTRTIQKSDYGLIRYGDSSRMSGTVFNIANDMGANNTSAGIIKYDISYLKDYNITDAKLNVKVDRVGSEARDTGYYYSYNVGSDLLGAAEHKLSGKVGGWYAGRNSLLKNCGIEGTFNDNEGGELCPGLVGIVAKDNTNATQFDMTFILQDAVSSGKQAIYIVIVKNEAGDSEGNGGWTDTSVNAENQSITVTAEPKNYGTGIAAAANKLNGFAYSGINSNKGTWVDWNGNGIYIPDTVDSAGQGSQVTYKNILWAGVNSVDNAANDMSSSKQVKGWLRHQPIVMIYDGITTPRAPIMTVVGTSSKKTRYLFAMPITDNDGNSLSLVHRWLGSRDNSYGNNWDWTNVYNRNGGTDMKIPALTDFVDRENHQIGSGTWSTQPGLANLYEFKGSFASGVYSKAITMTVTAYIGGSNDNRLDDINLGLTSNQPVYVINYKAILDKIASVKSEIGEIAKVEWKYTDASVQAYINAVNALADFDLNSYSFSQSTLASNVQTLADGIKNTIENYDKAKAGLTLNTFKLTYKFADGTTTVKNITAGNEAGEIPANSSPKYNGDKITHSVYSWYTTIDASTNVSGHTNLVSNTIIKQNVTITEAATSKSCIFTKANTTASTCTVAGVDTYTCGTCGGQYTEAAPLAAHTEQIVPAVPATCTEPGLTQGKKCSVCGTIIVYQETEKALGHNPVTDEAVAPNCDHVGYTEGSHCSRCNEVFTAQTEIPKREHKYEYKVVQQATCAVDGIKRWSCVYEDCSSYYDETLPATGNHDTKITEYENVVSATCSEDGSREVVKRCSVCKKEMSRTPETLYATGQHTGKSFKANGASCTAEGNTAYTQCTVCKKYFSDSTCTTEIAVNSWVIPMKDHTLSTKVVNPVNVNTTTRQPISCDESKTYSYTEVEYCTYCKNEFGSTDRVLDPLAHTENTVKGTPATCTTSGTTDYVKCSVCEKVITPSTVIDPLGHNIKKTEATEANCEHAGNSEYYYCQRCYKYYSDSEYTNEIAKDSWVIPKLPHSLITKNGNFKNVDENTFLATTCDEKLTCSYDIQTVCKNCSYKESSVTVPVDRLSHTEKTVEATAPTCTTMGLTEGKICEVCGKVLVAQTSVGALGHNIVYVEGKAPTCNDEGNNPYYKCENCNKYYEDAAGKREIAENSWIVSATGIHSKAMRNGNFKNVDPDTLKATSCDASLTYSYDIETYCVICDTVISSVPCPVNPLNHSGEKIPAVEATCSTAGSTEGTKCSVCDKILVQPNVVKKLNHIARTPATCISPAICDMCDQPFGEINSDRHINVITTVEAIAATCTEDGRTASTQCEDCGEILSVSKEIKAKGHVQLTAATCISKAVCAVCSEEYGEANGAHEAIVIIPAVDATCTTSGLTSGTKCDACDTIVKKQVTISALGHIGGTATCVSKAVCERCDAEYGDVDSSNHENKVDIPAVAPTCTETGKSVGEKCDACDKIIIVPRTIQPLGHTGGTATCTTLAVCERCDNEYGEVNSKVHVSTVHVDAVAPTCDKNGSTEGTVCEACGVATSGCAVVYATGHVGGTADCMHKAICEVCLQEYGSVNKKNHTNVVTDEAVAATCKESGLTAGSHCEDCEDIIVAQKVVTTSAHTKAAPVEENRVEATCVAVGGYDLVTYCSVCDTELSRNHRTIAKGPHGDNNDDGFCDGCGLNICSHDDITVVDAVDEDCTTEGYTGDKICVKCGELVAKGDVIQPSGHTFTGYVSNNDAECGKDGTKTGTCTVCGTTETVKDTGSALTHTGGTATCSQKAVCDLCGKPYGALSTEHANVVTDKGFEATCTSEGLTDGSHCTACNNTIVAQVVIPKKAHSLITEPGMPATCISLGSTEAVYCTVCHTFIKEATVLPKAPHVDNNSDGVCDECGGSLQNSANCKCLCHKKGVLPQFFYKIARFFWKLFNISKTCDCGAVHY